MMIQQLKFVIITMLLIPLTAIAQYNFEIAFPNLTFSSALDLQNAHDGSNRIFVVEQSGIIKVFPNQNNISTTKTFLDITDRVTSGGETGLLGLAFHPNYKNNGYFYVNYTATNPLRTVISRFSISGSNPDSANKNSEQILLTYDQPFSNHNGGCVAFGPDGYLYIAAGDGGSSGDPQNNAQNITSFLGKIIRIDVGNPQSPLNYGIPTSNPFFDSTNTSIRKEIYAWGMRNTWRFSFDPITDWLWAGDVGQGDWEEVDIIQNGKNYGWRCYEGNHPYNLAECNGTYELPIWEYSHSLGISITGGYVYRGQNVPELYGKYIYGDFGSSRVWALEYDGINPTVNTQITTAPGLITSFGTDENKELYLVSFNGKIYKFTPTLQVMAPTQLNGFSSIALGIPPDIIVNLSWNDNSDNENGFIIERKTNNQSFVVIDSVGFNITNYTEWNVVDTTLYTYRVRAYNDNLFSNYSNEIDILTLLRSIDGPINLVASTIDTARIQLNWLNVQNNPYWIKVGRKTGEGGEYSVIDSVSPGIETYTDQDLQASTTYFYKYFSYYENLVSSYSNEDSATTSGITKVEDEFVVKDYELFPNYPNPFNPNTIISFQIPFPGLVTLKVYDVLGNEVTTLVNEQKPSGIYDIMFNAQSLTSGIYFYELTSGSFSSIKKMILLK